MSLNAPMLKRVAVPSNKPRMSKKLRSHVGLLSNEISYFRTHLCLKIALQWNKEMLKHARVHGSNGL